MGAVLGGGPEGVVLLEPFANGPVYADVLAFLLRFNPLVFEDFIALGEEVFPEVAVGKRFGRFGGFGNYAGLAVTLIFLEGRDRDFEELDGFGGEVNLPGRLGGVRVGDEERAAAHNVLPGDECQILAAIEVEGGGAGVNLGKLRLGQRDADRSLAF